MGKEGCDEARKEELGKFKEKEQDRRITGVVQEERKKRVKGRQSKGRSCLEGTGFRRRRREVKGRRVLLEEVGGEVGGEEGNHIQPM